MTGQGLPAPWWALEAKVRPVALVQPASVQMQRVCATRWPRGAGPGIEQVATEPQLRAEGLDAQCRQHFATLRTGGNRQLVLAHVGQLDIQPIMAAGAEPACGIFPRALLRSQVELDRQFQMMHAVTVAQQHIEFAQGMTVATDRHVGADQFDSRCLAHRELPEPFVVQPEPTRGCQGQPVLQGAAVAIQLPQPVFQLLRRLDPVAAGQWMALRPRRIEQHRRRENDPGQIAHLGVTQLSGKVEQAREQDHSASIAGWFVAERILSRAGFRP